MRTVILGNSGSGKTWLAERLASGTSGTSVPAVHLDELFWQPGGFDQKRLPAETASLIKTARAASGWVVEGVFGELATPFLQDASALVWLDLNWTVCEARLRARGSESKPHMARPQSEAGLMALLEWASTYQNRDDSRSFAGHLALFQAFDGPKVRFSNEKEVSAFLEAVEREGMLVALQVNAERPPC